MTGNIMIIDDSYVDRKIISNVLKTRLGNINIYESDNGLEIASKLLLNNIHVCILDIMMPTKSGFQVLKEIKDDSALMDIPVIVCTGIDDKRAIEKALTLGAYDYFSKPLTKEAITISLPLKIKNAIDLMRRKEEIIYLSYHDKLTGLYNRRFFEEEMKRLDTERNLPISIIVGDVNGLKLTNDAFGHETGDKLLIKIANILKEECRSDEIIARISGDEYLILLPKTNVIDAKKVLYRIKERCNKEMEDPIKPSISLGFATKEQQHQEIINLLKIAEDRMYKSKLMESKSIRGSIVDTLRKTLYERSHETEEHCLRLAKLADKLGKKLNLTIDQIQNLKLLTLLHDIGFTSIPSNIMSKDENLTSEEQSIMESHCEIGYRIANASPDLVHIADNILSHHEQWDGSGYPQGLSEESIPLLARIFSVLDAYDVKVHGLSEKNQMTRTEALIFIKSHEGKQFDPNIVEMFLTMMSEELMEE